MFSNILNFDPNFLQSFNNISFISIVRFFIVTSYIKDNQRFISFSFLCHAYVSNKKPQFKNKCIPSLMRVEAPYERVPGQIYIVFLFQPKRVLLIHDSIRDGNKWFFDECFFDGKFHLMKSRKLSMTMFFFPRTALQRR